ncbi:MAG: glycosyl transferase, group 1 [uncultured bacterium]|nr:MAG: glycosyl transferase, group 1 [uncultured bacterium]
MKIAIHASDLDHDRIDGTRVYILSMLGQFGKLAPEDDFLIYHKTAFNSELTPPEFENYKIKALGRFPAWTHTKFAWEIFKKKPEVLWIGLHNLPWFRRPSLKTVVTIHDLAFKFFPEYFTRKDLFKLNLLADHAIKKADKIIAISNSTKKDILKLYPEVSVEKISVVHHGFNAELFQKEIPLEDSARILETYNLKPETYLLYIGAIQPRKNLEVLISAFEKIKESKPELKLVFAGEKAWMWEGVAKRIENSSFKKDIIITGKVPFCDMPVLLKNASIFVFPSLYEGFGIPVLEAFASGVPVICANNSSLPEVGGDASLYFEGNSATDLQEKIQSILESPALREELVKRGTERVKEFSWEKCAKSTLDIIKKK